MTKRQTAFWRSLASHYEMLVEAARSANGPLGHVINVRVPVPYDPAVSLTPMYMGIRSVVLFTDLEHRVYAKEYAPLYYQRKGRQEPPYRRIA